MAATTEPAPTAGLERSLVASDLAGRGAQRPAAERGDLVVTDRAIQHLLEAVARGVEGSVRSTSTLQRLAGRSLPSASVRIEGRRALVQLDVAVGWPSPIAQIAERVRDRVADEGGRLTGLSVSVVDVQVHVVDAPENRRRVE